MKKILGFQTYWFKIYSLKCFFYTFLATNKTKNSLLGKTQPNVDDKEFLSDLLNVYKDICPIQNIFLLGAGLVDNYEEF